MKQTTQTCSNFL